MTLDEFLNRWARFGLDGNGKFESDVDMLIAAAREEQRECDLTCGKPQLTATPLADQIKAMRLENQTQEGEAVSAYRTALDRIAKLEAALDELHLAAARREAIIAELRRNNEVMMGERQRLHDATQRHAKTAHGAEQLLAEVAKLLETHHMVTSDGNWDQSERLHVLRRIEAALTASKQALEEARRGT